MALPMPWLPAPDLLAPLAAWFMDARRDLPWRALDLDAPHPDPYAVLVSEVMLQQTQVATVIPYFLRWMERFPTPGVLAAAPEDTIHKAWEGLGYYRRARFLQAAAGRIASQGWPRDLGGLSDLPGLGPYTAAALGAIAFQWPTPALDGNAFRVLARLLALEEAPRSRAADLQSWLAPGLARLGPSRLTQAIMELGATICLPSPLCRRCPVAQGCAAQRTGRTREIPPPVVRPRPKDVSLWLLALHAEGHYLLQCPGGRGLLAGLWQWPAVDPSSHPPIGVAARGCTAWPGWIQVYTHRRETVHPLRLAVDARFPVPPGLRWIPREQLEALPMGRRDQRLRALLGSPGGPLLEVPDPARLLAALRGDGAPGA